MELIMTRKYLFFLLPLYGIGLSTPATAVNMNIDFTANIIATTCKIALQALNGSKVTVAGTNLYTLTIPDVGLDKIIKQGSEAQADFKLVATECSNGLSTISTKISGASTSGNLVRNESTATPAATNIGMGFKRYGNADSAFITPNNTAIVTWSAAEVTQGLDMTVALREITKNQGTIGPFEASATFSFTYQ